VFSYARSTDKLTTPMLHEFCSNLDDYFGGVTPAQAWMDFRSLSLVGTNASWREAARQLEGSGVNTVSNPTLQGLLPFGGKSTAEQVYVE